MRRKKDREGQVSIPVKDRAAEIGINLNTIFTALVLAGILWVGTTLESIKKTLNDNAVSMAVVQHETSNLRNDLDKHRIDPYAHSRLRAK
jgi:hypothetical protein